MGGYSDERGLGYRRKDKSFFSGFLGELRNFGDFLWDILPTLRVLLKNFPLGGTIFFYFSCHRTPGKIKSSC